MLLPDKLLMANRERYLLATFRLKRIPVTLLLSLWPVSFFGRLEKSAELFAKVPPQAEGINLDLLAHISPIGWENVVLYGEYILNRDSVCL